MSTGNDTVLPQNPVDQTTQPAATPPIADVVSQVVDVDEADLQAALAEVKAEETPSGQQPQAPAAGTQAPAAQAAAATGQQDHLAPTREIPAMIPRQRLDEALLQKTKAEQQAAYLQGQLDARTQAPAPAQAGAPAPAQQAAQPTPQSRLEQVKSAGIALSERYDAGEITYKELKAEEQKLADQEHQIRTDMMLAQVQATAPKPADQDGMYLETLTAQLETKHPWVGVFDQVGTQSEWKFLKDRAVENLIERGVDPTNGPAGKYELRKEMSELADQYGPTMVASRAQAKGIALPTAQQSQHQTQQQPPVNPVVAARTAALAKAAGAPPNLADMAGHAGNPGGLPTDGAVEAMDEAAFDAMPLATRRRMMGITA